MLPYMTWVKKSADRARINAIMLMLPITSVMSTSCSGDGKPPFPVMSSTLYHT